MNSLVRIVICAIAFSLSSCNGPQAQNIDQVRNTSSTEDHVDSLHQDTCQSNKDDTSSLLQPEQSCMNNTSSTQAIQIENPKKQSGMSSWVLFLLVIVEGCAIVFLFLGLKHTNKRINKRKREIILLINEIEGLKNIKIPYKQGYDSPSQSPSISAKNTPNRDGQLTNLNNGDKVIPSLKPKNDKPSVEDSSDLRFDYARHYKDGILEPVEKNDAFYEIHYPPNEKNGTFTFSGDTFKAIKNKSSEIDGVCETKGISSSAKSIKTTMCGRCERMADGKWKVTEKAKITFEQ